jgi:hypothetical protein
MIGFVGPRLNTLAAMRVDKAGVADGGRFHFLPA